MDPNPLRYHPLRYDLLRDSFDEIFEAFWEDDLTDEEIAEAGGRGTLDAIMESEEILSHTLADYDAAGQHIYHLEPKLIEMFRHTSVDDVPIELLTTPFDTIFIYIGSEGGIWHPVDRRVMDGAYVSLSHHEDGTLLFTTLCPEFPDLARARRLSAISRVRRDQGYRHLAFHSSAKTIGQARAFLTASYEERISEFEHYRMQKILRNAGHSSRKVSCEEARDTWRPEEEDMLWKEQDVEASNLIINALAFLTSRPDDIEYGWRADLPEKLTRKAVNVSDPKQAERATSKLEAMGYRRVYTCGRRVGARVGDSSHASPEVHWRRGHWRQQVHGQGRSDRKLIWIEPTLVSPSGSEPLGRIHIVSD